MSKREQKGQGGEGGESEQDLTHVTSWPAQQSAALADLRKLRAVRAAYAREERRLVLRARELKVSWREIERAAGVNRVTLQSRHAWGYGANEARRPRSKEDK